MKLVGLILGLSVLSSPVLAAQTFKLPITIIPGTFTFQGYGTYSPVADPVPSTFPISKQVAWLPGVGACSAGLVTVEANIVDGGLETAVNGDAVGPGCILGGEIVFEVEMPVPEVGGSSTAVRREPTVQSFSFSSFQSAFASFATDPATSTAEPEFGFGGATATELLWGFTSTNPSLSRDPIHMEHWIPGDTLRFKVRARIYMRSDSTHPAQGNVKVRWEYRVTVPEPSTGLSLPLGMAWLAGLSMMRGGV